MQRWERNGTACMISLILHEVPFRSRPDACAVPFCIVGSMITCSIYCYLADETENAATASTV